MLLGSDDISEVAILFTDSLTGFILCKKKINFFLYLNCYDFGFLCNLEVDPILGFHCAKELGF